jgi:hypothetical protein
MTRHFRFSLMIVLYGLAPALDTALLLSAGAHQGLPNSLRRLRKLAIGVAEKDESCYYPGVRIFPGRVAEIQIDHQGNTGARIVCPPAAVPAPGQYLLGRATVDDEAVLAVPLFLARPTEGGFLAAPCVPVTWNPGTVLELRGILGNGFKPPKSLSRLALAAFGETPARLLALAQSALEQNLDVALFTNSTVPLLPTSVEIQPVSALPGALTWADFLALDLPGDLLPRLRSLLGVSAASLPCPAQALVLTPMPCGALAECGVCAVPARRGWKLACKDGPVFDLEELEW